MTIDNLDMVQTVSANEIVLDEESQRSVGALESMDRLRDLMSARSMAEVAKKLGMTAQNLSNILQRKRLPFEKIAKWCNTYGVSINWVLFGTGSPKLSDKVVEKDENMDYLVKLLRDKVDDLEAKLASRSTEVQNT
tara:strand:+ start:13485 stop:13892 length:408 start_codon:yes stop_codon:yes gene_type:complete